MPAISWLVSHRLPVALQWVIVALAAAGMLLAVVCTFVQALAGRPFGQ
jgi:hypothetical protein